MPGSTQRGTLAALPALSRVGVDLDLNNNPSLLNITGFSGISAIGRDLYLTNNIQLERVDGLDNLKDIGRHLVVNSNDRLEDLSGFRQLTRVRGQMDVQSNETLESLAGLDNITASELDALLIRYNSRLTVCSVRSVCEYLGLNGQSNILLNNTGCNARREILNLCPPLSSTRENAFQDIRLFPNPNTGTAFLPDDLEIRYPARISVTDLTGRILSDEALNARGRIELPDHAGWLLITITDSDGRRFADRIFRIK